MNVIERVAAGVLAALAVSCAVTATAAAELRPFGLACQAKEAGVRFCPSTSFDQRVPSFDGVPLDVDVTLPRTGDGPFPTVVMLHGLTSDKTQIEAETARGDNSENADFNNLFYAARGYAVITPSERGFGKSCGTAVSRRGYPACAKGWLHMADRRYEARDAQTLLGRAVDAGLADPSRLGAIGVSYGGGQAMQLAFLRDRVALPDGSFAPWTSPKGTPLSIKAVYSRMGWTDLGSALQPNGRFDGVSLPTYEQGVAPPGVWKLTYGLVDTLLPSIGYTVPLGQDISADVWSWTIRAFQGEPYRGRIWDSVRETMPQHSLYGIPGVPAPLLVEGAYNDDMFPADQALRAYMLGVAAGGDVSIQLGDMGHPRASNDIEAARVLAARGASFIDAKLRGIGSAPAPGSARMQRFVCPTTAPLGAPITASSYAGLAKGQVTFDGGSWARPVTLRSSPYQWLQRAGEDPLLPQVVPIIQTVLNKLARDPANLQAALKDNVAGLIGDQSRLANACRLSTQARSSKATYGGAVVTRPYTLAGMASAKVEVRTTGPYGVISGRLWDVHPGGLRRLISRAVYRQDPNQQGAVTLHFGPQAYTFEAGHRPQLELQVNDSPYLKPSSRPFASVFGPVSVSLPTAEATP